MAKIICITTGLTGILNASFELVDRLKKGGHQIIYASPRDVKEQVTQQDVSFFQLPEIKIDTQPELPNYKGPFRKMARWFYKIKNAKELQRIALKKTDPIFFSQWIAKELPDLLIIDIELHEYIFKAYAQKRNIILLSQWFSLWNRKGLPYLLHNTIPGRGWKGTTWAIQFSWWKIKRHRWWIFTKKKFFSVHTDRRSILLALAKQEKFPLKYIKENYWPGPFSYGELPVLSMTAFEMEFPHLPRANLFYIGAMVHENRIDKKETGNDKYSLDEVFEYREKIKASLLYCSVSTLSKADEQFLKKLIEAVRKRKNWVLIVSLGALITNDSFKELPGNVFAFAKVPQLKILAKADCSINHGGIHTINECIHFEIPMLVYSGKTSDQNGCAARVAFHELGIMGDKDKDSPIEIRTKINQILTKNIYKENVKRMNQFFFKYKNESFLEKQIEKFISPNN